MLNLISYPTSIESGKIKNILSGFQNNFIEFKREDISINSIGAGLNNKISVTIENIDLTSFLNVSEFVYIYAETLNFFYDGSFEILDIEYINNDTIILLNTEFFEISMQGYINYKQNYFVEYKLVNVSNNNVLMYPYSLSEDGKSNGEIKLNINNAVDFLSSNINNISGYIQNSSVKFKVMYREVYRENETENFTLINELPLIVIYSAENVNVEEITNKFNEPIIFEGYPFFLNFIHSDENYNLSNIDVLFNELDINKNELTTNNYITTFNRDLFGVLQISFNDKTKAIENETEYIEFILNDVDLPDYSPTDYNSNDYKTT